MLPLSTRVFACTEPVDMRRSFSGLVRCTQELMQLDPSTGAVFILIGKRALSLKAWWWDKGGYCILYKRLSRGYLRGPAAVGGETSVSIEPRELALILEGIDLPKRKRPMKTIGRDARKKSLAADLDYRY